MWNYKLMKITVFFIACFLFLTVSLYSQEEEIAWNYEEKNEETKEEKKDVKITPDKDVVWVFDAPKEEEIVVVETVEKKGPLRVPERKTEIGFFNTGLGLSNDFKNISDYFKEKITLKLDDFSDGFNMNANMTLTPLYFSYNNDNIWGLGVSTGLDLLGAIGLSGNMLTFKESGGAESDLGAAVFTDIKLQGFFTYEKIKIKLKPAVYYPILYAKPYNFSYTYKNKKTNDIDETYLHLELDMRVYTAYPIEDDFTPLDFIKNVDDFSSKPGIDIGIGAEYPLAETLGLRDKFDFLDFDVGIDFYNIPLYPAEMEDYRRMIVNIGSDEPIDFFSGMLDKDSAEKSEEDNKEDFYNYKLEDYGKDRRNVFRPFKMLLSVNWRPFDSPLVNDSDRSAKIKREWLTFTQILGFSINPLYSQSFSLEAGIKTRFNFANFFIATLDLGYYDRIWKNSLDFALNFRVIEIDFGASVQSPGFLKSFTGGGFGATFGLKFGW